MVRRSFFPAIALLLMGTAFAAPPARTPPISAARIKTRIEAVIARYPKATAGVAVRDPATGTAINIRAKRRFHAASTMKLPVLITIFHDVKKGLLSLDDKIIVKNRFRSIVDGSVFRIEEDSDHAIYKHLGEPMTIRTLIHHMITVSSNLATDLLIKRVTPQAVQRTIERLGAKRMLVLRGVEDLKAYRRGLNDKSTARGLAILLVDIMQGKAVSPHADRRMIDVLLEQKLGTAMIPAGVPKSTRVAHKTGKITKIHHDAAIVYPQDAPPYVLVVLTQGIKKPKRSARLIAQISRVVYRGLRGRRAATQ
jgi:beta-lactamase class A